ncbi:nicotinate-nucleotide--dimethylbenzimidazole phosphoribosyltransferase [Desulfococcaceae bacterium HSG7]|nr:nicotinate-nucleotide--dimethylbenzimidazole phosphoribosyltransferase [Desulfococcaceae bacterium HSG7]
MKITLTKLKNLQCQEAEKPTPKNGYKLLNVLYCAICRTDAKMWHEGHRDLIFPRVPGHELVAADETGQRFTVWPGDCCGKCSYCKNGQENLCEHIKIMGFHYDGGFAADVLAPQKSLIPVPDTIPAHIACFAEPTGCALNALEKLQLKAGERIIIYGGGVLGLITALVCLKKGVTPLVIEKSEEKIDKSRIFCNEIGIKCLKNTHTSEFDAAFIACADHVAFSLSITKLAKGGRLSLFSGLTKNQNISTNLINLMHYKEIALFGTYGLTRQNMRDAVKLIINYVNPIERLVEAIIPPSKASELMPDVLSGRSLKYILDFSPAVHDLQKSARFINSAKTCSPKNKKEKPMNADMLSDDLKQLLQKIKPLNMEKRAAAQHKIDHKTKPLGALGKLEELALQMSLIQNDLNPAINRKALFVFAGDHGITEEGVSAYPSEVTGQMVLNFLNDGAAINVLCHHNDIDINVVDMGVNADFDDHPKLLKKKVRKGTRNFAVQEAMTWAEMIQALENGADVFLAEHALSKIDIVGMGEMGIGNTTSSSAIICAVTGITPHQSAGRGTGLDDKGVEHKAAMLVKVLDFQQPNPENGFDILHKIGGYEIAGIVGAVLAAASQKTAIVLDGVISTAAGLIACQIQPNIKDYLIAGHSSVESAQQAALAHIGIEPVIDFKMRLGEGTGAALTIDVVAAACKIMCEMASFEDAGVSNKD